MTEQEWLECSDLDEALEFLWGKANDRKLRLFACACCRRIWGCITEQSSRQAIEISERYADGRATLEELETAFAAADRTYSSREHRYKPLPIQQAHDAARLAAHPVTRGLANSTASAAAASMAAEGDVEDYWECHASKQAEQCNLLREILGPLPFRAISIDPAWLTSKDGTVVKLAQSICDERAFDRMPILAEALEDAGCDNTGILNHCRQPGQHVRGCWVVDLLLGKE